MRAGSQQKDPGLRLLTALSSEGFGVVMVGVSYLKVTGDIRLMRA